MSKRPKHSDAQSVYRCAECGHGQRLEAIAGANVSGPLAADGDLESYDSIEDTGIYEDSIQCSDHPGAPVEKSIAGQWCQWWFCPDCGGTGRVHVGENWRAPGGYACSAQKTPQGIHTGQTNGHEGWRPVEAIAS
jgi:hypothetical protein